MVDLLELLKKNPYFNEFVLEDNYIVYKDKKLSLVNFLMNDFISNIYIRDNIQKLSGAELYDLLYVYSKKFDITFKDYQTSVLSNNCNGLSQDIIEEYEKYLFILKKYRDYLSTDLYSTYQQFIWLKGNIDVIDANTDLRLIKNRYKVLENMVEDGEKTSSLKNNIKEPEYAMVGSISISVYAVAIFIAIGMLIAGILLR